jgi:hypothetical protein
VESSLPSRQCISTTRHDSIQMFFYTLSNLFNFISRYSTCQLEPEKGDSRGIKLLLQSNPRINNFNLFHTPIQPSSHFVLLSNFRTLISNTFIMLSDIFQCSTVVLVIECFSCCVPYCEDRGEKAEGLESGRREDFLGFFNGPSLQEFVNLVKLALLWTCG